MTEPGKNKYRLSAALIGHGADVRALSTPSSVTLFSSSRDKTARAWHRGSEETWELGPIFAVGEGQGYVNTVLAVTLDGDKNAVESQPTHVLTGGQDAIVYVFPLDSWTAAADQAGSSDTKLQPIAELAGHASNVCALSATPDGKIIVSGSWDNTAIVWQNFAFARQLAGHSMAVWAVLAIPQSAAQDQEPVLTASADQTIKLWRGAKEVQTFKGHTGPVRALSWLGALGVGPTSSERFASAGNDATVRIWTLVGESIAVLDGHTSFVYSLALIPPADGNPAGLVSGGEDRAVRVWGESGNLEQTIYLPAISVWAVSTLPNGDIAAATNDAIIRVFTRDPSRLASESDLAAFDEQVQGQTLNQTQVGDVKKTDLPGMERLQQPGTKPDQVIMVKNMGNVEAYQWTGSDWQKIGEVVDAVGQGRKQLYQGREYDYVFDVDIKDGAPPLKLPYNANENPFKAAEKFLNDNELPHSYVDQVVDFINKNTGGATLEAGYRDPYTGASSYRPSGATGGSAAPTSSAGDPWTGGGRTQAPASTSGVLPHRTFLTFPDGNITAIKGKLQQFNTELAGEPSHSLEAADIDSLFTTAEKAKSTKSELSDVQQASLIKLLSWPTDKRFPALDLVRILAIGSMLPQAAWAPLLESVRGATAASPAERERNAMLSIRAVVNATSNDKSRNDIKGLADQIDRALSASVGSGLNKNGALAAATLALNLSILALKRDIKAHQVANLLPTLENLLNGTDSETVYRALVALGNLRASEIAGTLAVGQVQQALVAAKNAQGRLNEDRIKAVVAELERL